MSNDLFMRGLASGTCDARDDVLFLGEVVDLSSDPSYLDQATPTQNSCDARTVPLAQQSRLVLQYCLTGTVCGIRNRPHARLQIKLVPAHDKAKTLVSSHVGGYVPNDW